MPYCKEAANDQVKATPPPITIVFGRFNPPTVGHEKLLRAAQREAQGGDLRIYPSRTQDPKKNPLDPTTKIAHMRKMFPDLGGYIIDSPETKTILDALAAANRDGYSKAIIVVGSDRQEEFHGLTQKYNGNLYTFDSIQVISAGVRDADSEGAEGMSASKMRQAVASDDFPLFRSGIPSTLGDEDTKALFDAVRKGMG